MTAGAGRPLGPMRAPAFLDWAAAQAAGRRELIHGYVTPLADPSPGAARAVADATLAFAAALRVAGAQGRVFGGGVPVVVDDATVLAPDLVIGGGGTFGVGGVAADGPVIVVEAVSPGRALLSAEGRAALYLRAPGVAHVLTLDATARMALWRRRDRDGRLQVSAHTAGALRLSPPGVTIEIDDLFLTA